MSSQMTTSEQQLAARSHNHPVFLFQPHPLHCRSLAENIPVPQNQRRQYQEFIDRVPDQLTLIDQHIARMNYAMNIYYYARDKLIFSQDTYNQILNIDRPHIHMLPESVLLRIFTLLREDEMEEAEKGDYRAWWTILGPGDDDGSSPAVRSGEMDYHVNRWPHIGSKLREPVPWTLSKVCQAWKHLIKSRPSMWRDVYLDLGAPRESLCAERAMVQVVDSKRQILHAVVKSSPWSPVNEGTRMTFVKGRGSQGGESVNGEGKHSLTVTSTGTSAKLGTRVLTVDNYHPTVQPLVIGVNKIGSLLLDMPLSDLPAFSQMRGRLDNLTKLTVYVRGSSNPLADVTSECISQAAAALSSSGFFGKKDENDIIETFRIAPRLDYVCFSGFDVDMMELVRRLVLPSNHLRTFMANVLWTPRESVQGVGMLEKPSMGAVMTCLLDVVKSQNRLKILHVRNFMPVASDTTIVDESTLSNKAKKKAKKALEQSSLASTSGKGEGKGKEGAFVHSGLSGMTLMMRSTGLSFFLNQITCPNLNSLQILTSDGIPFSAIAEFLNRSSRYATYRTGQHRLKFLSLWGSTDCSITENDFTTVFRVVSSLSSLALHSLPRSVFQGGFLERILALPPPTNCGLDILPLPFLTQLTFQIPDTVYTPDVAERLETIMRVMVKRTELEHTLMRSNARPGILERAMNVGAFFNAYGTCLTGIHVLVSPSLYNDILGLKGEPLVGHLRVLTERGIQICCTGGVERRVFV